VSGENVVRARVLVADDHPSMLERIVTLLHHDFSVVGTVQNGEGLVHAEAALQPDVMVVDVCMPGVNGLEATDCIKRRGSRAVVIFLSAHREPEIIEAAWELGALGYVAKTCMAQDLVPAVRAALEGRRYISRCLAAVEASHS